ncbi:metallo-beta-lactamase [Aurantiacibacter flavus]|uniref:Metallo-beta-lactamase n=1 Tax=Aurantiacibacter flavus TaxID=3145232 RepID=A0ABV0CW81_9SPHN
MSTLSLSACAAGADPTQTSRADAPSAWPQACEDWDEWDKPGPPFALAGTDSYYVGTCGIAAILIDSGDGLILIDSGDGLILIDSGTNEGADMVLANIAALGFDTAEVKLVLTSHEHFDHIGGMAKIQQATGAKLVTSQAAAEVLNTGEVSPEDPQFGTIDGVMPAKVGRIVGDGDVVELGDKRLVAIATPGHTHGALSWNWEGCDAEGQCRSFVYADSLSPVSSDSYGFSDHPDYVADLRKAIARAAPLACDVLVTPTPRPAKCVKNCRRATSPRA